MYFVTVADQEHFPWLLILLDTIKRFNPKKRIEILVVDIGLEKQQIQHIQEKYPAKVVPIEKTHPDLTKKFVVRDNGRLARGWYAWKPVAMKQGFDYFPYFLYIDAGKRLTGPCDDIFQMILQDGYFLFDCGHIIDPMTTQRVRDKFDLDSSSNAWILKKFGVEAGIQGLSRHVYEAYIKPMYELTYELSLFEDDGTAPWGFGGSRHDQTLFSICARKLGLVVHKVCGNGPVNFVVKGKKILFNRNFYFQYKEFKDNPNAVINKLI